VSIQVNSGVAQVRLRFTDGQGSYSSKYTTINVEIPSGECDPTITLPFSESMNGTVTGCLYGSASESEGCVLLTPDAGSLYGAIGYETSLPAFWQAIFDFKHYKSGGGGADSVYLYFYCNAIPQTEHGEINEEEMVEGYVVGFSEYGQEISIYYGHTQLASVSFNFDNNTWNTAKVVFNEGNFWIYMNNGLAMSAGDSDFEIRTINSEHGLIGLGARTGAISAEHYVKLLTIEETD